MKLFIRRWLLSRKLRAISFEINEMMDLRLKSLKREAYLKGCADAVRVDLMHLEIKARRHA
jgi:hypothetical protein